MLAYRPPPLDALMCRRSFYSNSKLSTESITDWFERVAKSINGCEFDNFTDIMLIDKFLSGIDEAVYQQIRKENSLDSSKALLVALATESLHTNSNESNEKCGIFLKVEIEEEHQETGWLDNEDDSLSFDDHTEPPMTDNKQSPVANDVKVLETPKLHPIGEKASVKRNGKQENRKTKNKTTREKREDFKINDQNRLVCQKCPKSYANRKSFRRHYLIHTESCTPCPKCGKLFPNKPSMLRHMPTHDSDDKRNVECYICRLDFREMTGLRVHLGKEHKLGTISIECVLCHTKFNSQQRYDKHMIMHNEQEIPHVCEFCGKNFDRKANWKRHLLIHTNVRNHTCELCGKSFGRKDRLDTHILVHTGERPHACRFCPKKFRLLKDRQTHERSHTGDKPYRCNFPSCEKAFARHEGFQRHKRMHAHIRPYPCDMCDKKFATKYHMQRHMTVHTGQKPYCCERCGNRFTQLGSLRMHTANVHGQLPIKSEPDLTASWAHEPAEPAAT